MFNSHYSVWQTLFRPRGKRTLAIQSLFAAIAKQANSAADDFGQFAFESHINLTPDWGDETEEKERNPATNGVRHALFAIISSARDLLARRITSGSTFFTGCGESGRTS